MNAPSDVAAECGSTSTGRALYEEGITCMVEDDDTNYTVTGLAVIKQCGADYTREVAGLPATFRSSMYASAERAAYKNLATGIPPPLSREPQRNVYREWMWRANPGRLLLGTSTPRRSARPWEDGLARRLHQPRQERHLRRDVGGAMLARYRLRHGRHRS